MDADATTVPGSEGDGTGAPSVGVTSEPTPDADDGDDPRPDVPQPVRYAEVQEIFDTSCVVGCHEPDGDFERLLLGDNARGELIFVSSIQSPLFYVEMGSHENSYLWHKLAGSQGSVDGMGSRMPAGGADALAPEAIDLVARWIDAGAPP